VAIEVFEILISKFVNPGCLQYAFFTALHFLRRSATFARYSLTWPIPNSPVEIGFETFATSANLISSFWYHSLRSHTTIEEKEDFTMYDDKP
jgi:hypothetical protein